MSDINITKVASISTKTFGYTKKALREMTDGKPDKVFIARIGGVAIEKFTGETKSVNWVGLRGSFSALTKDNVGYHATTCFLPGSLTKKIIEQLDAGVVEVEFFADIYVTYSDKSGTDYAYLCEPIVSEEAIKKAETISNRLFASALPNDSGQKVIGAPKPAKKSA